MFSDNNEIKLDINSKNITKKFYRCLEIQQHTSRRPMGQGRNYNRN